MAKKFKTLIYVLKQDGEYKYATNALNTMRKELVAVGFKLPSVVTMAADIKATGIYVSGSVCIVELGLFGPKYSVKPGGHLNK